MARDRVTTGIAGLDEQQGGDEETGKDEEEVDTEIAAAKMPGMEEDHGGHGRSAQPVECGDVTKLHGMGHGVIVARKGSTPCAV